MTDERPTLKDVAARAGVSLKTASRAINGEAGVADATGQRVAEAAHALGFRPNLMARSLRAGTAAATVGFVMGVLGDQFYSTIARSLERELDPRGLLLVTASHEEDPVRQKRLIRALVERRVDGLVLVPAAGDISYLTQEIERGLHVVAVDRPAKGVGVDTVLLDNIGGARAAVAKLIAAGHRRIALVGEPLTLWTTAQRRAGYVQALIEAGIEPEPELERVVDRTQVTGPEATLALLDLPNPPTAIFATNSLASLGMIRAVRMRGARVAVVGFDDLPEADILDPAPTTVVNDAARMGQLAAQQLLSRLDGEQRRPRRIVVPAEIVDRGIPLLMSPVDGVRT